MPGPTPGQARAAVRAAKAQVMPTPVPPRTLTAKSSRPQAFSAAANNEASATQAASASAAANPAATDNTAAVAPSAVNARKTVRQSKVDEGERLHKLIARAGLASRRAAEEMIAEGRVVVNGHVIRELGFKADPDVDRIVVDGHPLRLPSGPTTVVALHKPRGVMTTKDDPEGRATVMELLPTRLAHLHPVGRLDFETSGLLLLTDEGELTQKLTHPSHGVEKVYQARVRGNVSLDTVRKLENGVFLDDGKTAPCRVRVRAQTERNALLEITLHEGRNRQVRRMLEAVGYPVSSLRRIRFGPIDLVGIAPGDHRILLPGEVHLLHKAADSKTKPLRPRAGVAKGKQKSTRVAKATGTTSARSASAKTGTSAAPKAAPSRAPRASGSQSTGGRSTSGTGRAP
ncbi:MAG: rRNA synthase, partial [Abditibacteriota bacterium]|nr:rRNA synthase [Abditibacteriota bacterium]